MKNINEKVRQYISHSIDNLDVLLENKIFYYEYDIYKIFNKMVLMELQKILFEDIKVMYTFMELILYSDAYAVLNYKDKNNKLSTEEKRYFKRIKNIDNYDKLDKCFDNDPNLVSYMLKTSKIFTNLKKFDKVLVVKSLDEESKNQIKKINMFYQNDVNEYDINVDDYFIINEIKVLKHHYERLNKEDKSYTDTVNFLNKLNKIEDISDILISMDVTKENLNENIVRNYFESMKSKVIKLSRDDIDVRKTNK